MTQVYTTRTGTKYHAHADCPSLLDVERDLKRPIERMVKDLHGLSTAFTRCSVCWPRVKGYDAWRQLALDVEQTGHSLFEALLVEQVLSQVPGLRPGDVSPQRRATGRSGDTYYLDFVLSPVGGHRIAVEVDGRDKDPGGKTPAEVARDVERKRADLIAAGWKVLNFRNERVANQSDQCVTEIRAALGDAVPARDPSQEAMRPWAPAPVATPAALPPASDPARSKTLWFVALGVLLVAVAAGVWWWLAASGGGPVEPVGGECPSEAPIKGNINADGEKIYHQPGWEFYEQTGAEACFATTADAEEAGYRASEVQ